MRASRTLPTALVASLAAVALTGCTPNGPTEPAPSLDEALGTYTNLRDEAIAALQSAPDARDLTWSESGIYPSIAEQDDGECVLFVTSANGTGTIDDAVGLLTSLAASLDPVLDEHGMEPLSEPRYAEYGGDVWVESAAPTGWTVELRGGGQSSPAAPDALVELSIDGPVTTEACNAAALEEALADAG